MPAHRRSAVNGATKFNPAWLLLPLLVLPGAALYRLSTRVGIELLLIGCAVISAFCFIAYWIDKRRAESGGWRIPESTLHLLELAGGWPAALLAQQLFRHKTAKLSYQVVFWSIVVGHQFLALDYLLGWRVSRSMWQLVAG